MEMDDGASDAASDSEPPGAGPSPVVVSPKAAEVLSPGEESTAAAPGTEEAPPGVDVQEIGPQPSAKKVEKKKKQLEPPGTYLEWYSRSEMSCTGTAEVEVLPKGKQTVEERVRSMLHRARQGARAAAMANSLGEKPIQIELNRETIVSIKQLYTQLKVGEL